MAENKDFASPPGQTTPDLETVLTRLQARRVPAGIQTFFGAGLRVWVGDELHGVPATAIFATNQIARAVEWLLTEANRQYPE